MYQVVDGVLIPVESVAHSLSSPYIARSQTTPALAVTVGATS
jgi:hypothetical protein